MAVDQGSDQQLVHDPFARSALKVAYHLRRYVLLYVCGILGALAVTLFPTVPGGGPGQTVAAGGASGPAAQAGAADATGGLTTGPSTTAANAAVAAGAAGAGAGAASAAQGGGGPAAQATGASGGAAGTGVTVAGVACRPGVRQLPYSQYADPCVSKWTGNNGGATYNGVTASTITIAIRHTSDSTGANAAALNAENEAAGGQPYSTVEGYTKQIVAYFNKTMEFYGRHIKLVDFSGQGNYTNEELGQDQAAACADADQAATSVHAFGVIDFEGNFEPDPFAACAARYHLYIPQGSPYFPESTYQSYSPYVWATPMNCQLIAQEVAEFVGKQIAPYPARWAGTDVVTNMANTQRKLATYVPNNAGYQQCVNESLQIEENRYHIAKSQEDQYNYALNISTFPQDAQRAIVQFAANHDTTIVLACDPISPIFLTQDAVQQNYHPEWMLIGVALTDTDNWAQLWDQQEVNGHLFGLSQAGSTAVELAPNGEAGQALAAAGVPLNASSALDYYELLSMANQIQAAGPDLTPANIARGTEALPPAGGPTGASGTWHFGTSHTAIIDSREIYWDGSQTSQANGKQGTYIPVYGGRRFQLGQFPTGEPPFYS